MKVDEQRCEVFFPVNNHQCWLFEGCSRDDRFVEFSREDPCWVPCAQHVRKGFEVHAFILGQRRSFGLPVNKTNVG